MRVNSIRNIRESKESMLSWLPSAVKLVRSRLAAIEQGRLLLTDDDQMYEFGQCAEHAVVTGRIHIEDPRTYTMIAHNGILGAAEAYIQGFWNSPDLLAVIRVMARNIDRLQQLDQSRSGMNTLLLKLHAFFHRNNLYGSRRNIAAHYDLGNAFFSLFLDSTMMYSSAIYAEGVDCLEQAARHKLDVICRKLDLQQGQRVVEIGSGWGGFACHAAQHYGVHVTTTTISREQYEKTCQRVADQGLQDRVTVLFNDYRDLTGQYDRLVSIEMIEAVGHEFYPQFFSRCASLLKADGKMLLQAILVSDQRYHSARHNVDFIKRYIFPGGCLPSVAVIGDQVASHTDLQITAYQDISFDYARTLAAWRERFLQQLPAVRQQGFSDTFIRMWDFYFCYCQAGFMERTIHTAHIEMAKPQWRDHRYPHC